MDYNKKISDLTIGELTDILRDFANTLNYGAYWRQQTTTMPTSYPPVHNPGPKPYEVWCESKGGKING